MQIRNLIHTLPYSIQVHYFCIGQGPVGVTYIFLTCDLATKSDYECFICKKKININDLKYSDCDFVTIYGKRRKKYIVIFPIIIGYLFVLVKFNKTGMFV